MGPNIDPKKDGILYELGSEDIYSGNVMKLTITAEKLFEIISDKQIKGIYIKLTTKDK